MGLSKSGTSVSDSAYDATSWDGVTTVAPSKNAVRDKIEALSVVTQTAISTATVLTSANFGQVIVCSGSAAYQVTLPTAVGFTGQVIQLRMSPSLTALVTIVGTSAQTIGGAASRVQWANESVTLVSNGTNWDVLGAISKLMVCTLRLSSATQSMPVNTTTLVAVNQTDLDPSGLMADLTNHGIKAVRAGNYRIAGTVVWDNTSTTRAIGFLATDGGTVPLATCEGSSGGSLHPTLSMGNTVALTVNQVLCLYGFPTGNTTAVTGGATGTACLITMEEVV